MILLRSIVFNIVFYLVLVGMLIVGLPILFGSEQTVRNWATRWGRVSASLFERICDVTIEIRGTENLPAGGFILAAKHQSFLDTMILLPLAPRFVFVLKRELTWIPLFGLFLTRSGMIPIDRSKGRAVLGQLSERVGAVIRRGQQLIIFPEGTRRAPGAPPSYRSGIAHLYAGTGAPCVPVALNTGMVWGRRSFIRMPGTVVVDVLPPIPAGLAKDEFLATLQDRIETASDRLLAAPASGVR